MSCPTCKGYGFVVFDVPVGHPKFGRAQPCMDCNRVGAARAAWLRSICRVPPRYADVRLNDFRTLPDTAAIPALVGAKLKEPGTRWLTFWGEPGVGKTLLLCAAVNEAVGADKTAVYTTMPDLLDHLRRAFNPENKVNGDQFWDLLVRADVLALDEIDRFNPTPWAKERVFELFNARYNEPGLTLLATNKPAGIGQAIFDDAPGYLESRISQGVVLEVRGADRRPYYREAA